MSKLIFVNRYFYPDLSATSQILSDLAFGLAESGDRICIVTSRQTYENPKEGLAPRETRAGVEIYRVATTSFGRSNLFGRALDYLSFYVSSFVMLLRITSHGDVVVAKTDPPLISVIAWIAARTRGARLVNWLQDVFPEVAVALGILNYKPLASFVRWLRNLSLHGAVMNVVLSEKMQKCIYHQGVAKEKTLVIHNWADGDLIRPIDVASNGFRKSWGLVDRFVVGYSGNMGRAHEFDTVIEAMRLLSVNRNIVFLFIGGGAGKKELESAVSKYQLSNCIFKPYQPRECLSESLSLPDVHLVSLRPELEGLVVPSKIYGILAAARPVIVIGDPEGDAARFVRRLDSGFVVPVGSGRQLSNCIMKMARNPALAKQRGENGRKAFDAKYGKEHAVLEWRGMFESL